MDNINASSNEGVGGFPGALTICACGKYDETLVNDYDMEARYLTITKNVIQ